MNRALAPSWLPRQQRRRLDRALRKLMRRNVCSFCGSSFKHNSHSASGFDTHGNVAVAGECCIDRMAKIFALGLFSARKYDFLQPRDAKPDIAPTTAQIIDAIAACQKAIAETDKRFDSIERRGGIKGEQVPEISLRDHPWKTDDRAWFEQNRARSHRARLPFPGELSSKLDETAKLQAARPPILDKNAEIQVLMLVRQVEPGGRLRAAITISADLLPLPDDEAVAHALFEVAMEREAMPPDRAALCALAEKYTPHRESSQ
jgi:hypothetical protein